jgi:hypothetical protein
MPTMGFSKSPSPKPTARSMARLGERCTPWVTMRLLRLSGMGFSCALRATGAVRQGTEAAAGE